MSAFQSHRWAQRRVVYLVCSLLWLALPLSQPGSAAAIAGSGSASGAVEVTTQNAYRFQGWGTSLAWWANVVGGWESSRQVEEALFGLPDREHPDRLGLNVIRYNIGASPVLWCDVEEQTAGCAAEPSHERSLPVADLGRLPACRTFGPGKAVPAIANAPGEQPEAGRDRNQLAVLRGALSRQPRRSFLLEAFANSPPWWLTVSGCPQGNPNAFDVRDNLAVSDHGAYADYLASVLIAFQQRGIVFDTLDPLNEPENPWGQDNNPYTGQPFCTAGCQEGMHFGPEPPLRQIPSLGALLEEVCGRLGTGGIRTGVSFPDGFNPSDTGALLALTGALPGCLGQINTHMYDFIFPNGVVPYGHGISIYDPHGLSGGRQRLSTQAQALSRRLWMSEFSTGGAGSDITSGLNYSSVVAADMRWLRPAAWVNWQAVEGSGGWGLFESPSWPREGPLTRTKRFSALEHYARFIRPGYQILTTLDPMDDAVHERTPTMAAMDDLQHPRRIVVVATNDGTADRHAVYDLSGLGGQDLLTTATVTRYRTTAADDVQRLGSARLRTASLADDQPPASITTYVIEPSRDADRQGRLASA